MKLSTLQRDVQSSGSIRERKFTVNAGPHIMSILSGLYSNPIDAMVREYLTNMIDAYTALTASNPDAEIIAPVLHLPNAMDGNLIFRDYGIGMSVETVWEVYSSYGSSTKNDSNDSIGGFGIGSKTAFCYNGGASWMIESRYDGQKHLFMAYIGEDGTPMLNHINSVDSNEHTGVTVTIPIKRSDFAACVTAARKYLEHFPMRVDVTGEPFEDVVPEYAIRGKTWGVRGGLPSSRSSYLRRYASLVMGHVPYPLNEATAHASLDFFVEIGDVDIVPSRDALFNNARTAAKLKELIATVKKELPTAVANRLDQCNSKWEVLQTINILQKYPVIDSYVQRAKPIVADSGNEFKFHASMSINTADLKSADPQIVIHTFRTDYNCGTPDVLPVIHALSYVPSEQYFVVSTDEAQGMKVARAVARAKFANIGKNNRMKKYGHKAGSVLLFNTSLSIKEIQQFLGGVPTDLIISAQEYLGKLPKESRASTMGSIYKWVAARWEARAKQPTDAFYYIVLSKQSNNRFAATVGGGWDRPMARSILELLSQNKDATVLYGVKDTDVATLGSNAISCEAYLNTIIDNLLLTNFDGAMRRYLYRKYPTLYSVDGHVMGLKRLANGKCPLITAFCSEVQQRAQGFQSYEYEPVEIAFKYFPAIVAKLDTIPHTLPDPTDLLEAITEKYPVISLLIDLGTRITEGPVFTKYRNTILDFPVPTV